MVESEALAVAFGDILKSEARSEGNASPTPLARRTLRFAPASAGFQELKHEAGLRSCTRKCNHRRSARRLAIAVFGGLAVIAKLVVERILVLAQIRRVIGIGHGEARRQVRVEQPCPFQLGEAWQVLDRVEAEMAEELLCGAVGHGTSWRAPAAPELDPAGFEQHVEGSLGCAYAPDFLHLGAGDRLVIGDDGQG